MPRVFEFIVKRDKAIYTTFRTRSKTLQGAIHKLYQELPNGWELIEIL